MSVAKLEPVLYEVYRGFNIWFETDPEGQFYFVGGYPNTFLNVVDARAFIDAIINGQPPPPPPPPVPGLVLAEIYMNVPIWFQTATFKYIVFFNGSNMSFVNIQEAREFIESGFVITFPLLIAAEAVPNGVPESIQIDFSINGIIKRTPYAESLETGRYRLIFPQTLTIKGVIYTILGRNDFTITHPQNDETYFKASYFRDLPPPPPPPPPPPGWVVEKEVHLFDRVRVKSEMWDISKSITRFLRNVDIRLLEGGRLDYSITYLQGNSLPIPRVKVFFNEDVYVESPIRLRETKTGSIDLTGLILRTNSITLEVESTILLWAECAFDIWVTLGFSEDPIIDPGPGPDWDWWWPWAIAGGVSAVAVVGGAIMAQEIKHREEMLALMVGG